MERIVLQDRSGVREVAAELRTAVGMGEDLHARAIGQHALRLDPFGDVAGEAIDAAHERNDPKIIAHADVAVRPLEGPDRRRFRGRRRGVGFARPGIVEDIAERGLHVVGMNMRAAGDWPSRDADRRPVLRHRLALGDVANRKFVPAWNVVDEDDVIGGNGGAGRQRLERHGDRVDFVDLEGEGHGLLLKR